MRRAAGHAQRRGPRRRPRTAAPRRTRRGKAAARAQPPAAELKREIERRLVGGRCAYCGVSARPERPLTREHVIPRSRGAGRREWRVIVPACVECNRRRGVQPLAAFLLGSPARLAHLLAYLRSLPDHAIRHVDVRVFAEILAAIALQDNLRVDGAAGAQCPALRERALQRRRRAARHLLERLREGSAPGGKGPESTARSPNPAVAPPPLRSLAAVLALAWQLPEGQVAGRLAERVARYGSRARPARAATAVHPQGERAVA